MARPRVRGAAVALLLGTTMALTGCADSTSDRVARGQVVDLEHEGRPLRGRSIDLVAVGDSLVGLVATEQGNRVVTSEDGASWQVLVPEGLPHASVPAGVYPGGLGQATHRMFTDGTAVYVRTEPGPGLGPAPGTALYASDANRQRWREVTLPAPAGATAFPIAAARDGEHRYLAGAIALGPYGPDYLDAAVWTSDDGRSWARTASPAFGGPGNQTIFTIAATGEGALLAGGGDNTLVPKDECCYYPNGVALWRGHAGAWQRVELHDHPYLPFGTATVVGFVTHGPRISGDVSPGYERTLRSPDRGVTWRLDVPQRVSGGLLHPRAGATISVAGRLIATTEPDRFCGDCTQGAIGISDDGEHWRDVTPHFPCGNQERRNYGFISRPVVMGDEVVALGGCGPPLDTFRRLLLASSHDAGRTWGIREFDRPTGAPLTAVTAKGRIITLTGGAAGSTGPIRAVVVAR